LIRRLLAWLKWVVPLAAAFFMGRIVYLQWQKVREFDWRPEPEFLALSFFCTSCWFFVRAFVWRTIVAHFGRGVPYRESIRIFALSELTRYVPGTVWQYLSRVYLAGRWGVPAPVTVTASLMDLLLMALAAIPLVLWRIEEVFPLVGRARGILLVAFPIGAALLLHPVVLNRLAQFLLPRFQMQYEPIRIGFAMLCRLWACYLLLWMAFGAGFVLFARSLAAIGFSRGLELASNYAISWLAGVVSTWFAPGGIGVREGILGLLLAKILPEGLAFLVAVLSRLWLILLELFWAGVAQLYFRAPLTEGRR